MIDDDAACLAPWTALHFDQHGWVTACTANKRDCLGHVARDRLADLWVGAAAHRFRSMFASGALGEGCDLCRWQREHGGASTMYARLYDDRAELARAEGPIHVEFALSNRCNLACQMCNGGLSSTIRRNEGLPPLPAAYPDRFFDELADVLPGVVQAKFLGGEPFLAPENFRIWNLMIQTGSAVDCHVTTNGTIWNQRVEEVLDRLPMSFAVSLDGATAATVERIRVGSRFADVLANIERFQAHAARHGTNVSLTYCLMVDNWRELPAFLLLAEDLGLSTFVNTVMSPFRHSVYQLGPAEMGEVLTFLEGQSAFLRTRLVRNLGVWEDQLRRLRASGGALASQQETPVHFPSFAPPQVRRAPNRREGDVVVDLRSWSPVVPARFEIDPGGRITLVEAGHLGPLNVGRLVGAGVDELFVWLSSAFGRPAHSAYLRHDDQRGDRVLRFEAATGPTEVRVVSARTPSGADWLVSTRTPTTEPGAT